MGSFNLVSQGDFSTVLANKDELKKSPASREYQSERELEDEFIGSLRDLGYEYKEFHDEKSLEQNLREQIERLNEYRFSDADWDRFCNEAFSNLDREKATSIIQEDSVKDFTDERGELHNIKLVDKENLFRNSCQVIHQFIDQKESGRQKNRYDVTILVNGLPLVHCELKRRDVSLKTAFNQVDRYKAGSFSDGMGLFNFIQIFVISNGGDTRYYSNTVEQARSRPDEDNFKFACRWTDQRNNHISDLDEFAEAFFNKRTLLNLLTRYCVFTAKTDGERRLLVMRPYQVAATEKVLEKISQARLNGNFGKERQGGYIWHTTGSGKTLTSFKAATLASRMEGVDKVLVVVDRQDLDYQTIKEYNSYEEGCVDFTSNSNRLKAQLEDGNKRLIVTTIQKLNALCRKKGALEKAKNLNLVFIFDECHRSQFGMMHSNIVNSFKKYLLFGFTGTPIFESDKKTSSEGREIEATTPNIFGERLHEYTIVHAINDGTVLPFQYSYVGPGSNMAAKSSEASKVKANAGYIVENFGAYTHEGRYNSILATESIPAAKEYWNALRDAQKEKPENLKMAMAIVYSSAGGERDELDPDADKPENKAFLKEAVSEYNRKFGCSFSVEDDESFQDYYRDVSEKMKARRLDLLIVVNMFLTGFDSKHLSTLWVDKNLKKHNLIQAFSRTNRILDSTKDRGVIVSFRDLEERLNESLFIYGTGAEIDKGLIFGHTYRELMDGWEDKTGPHEGYKAVAQKFQREFPVGGELIGGKAKRKFVEDWNNLLKRSILLSTFPEFSDENPISPRDVQTYKGTYLDIYEQFKSAAEGGADFKGVEWEVKLLSQKEIDVDYILNLNAKGATREDIARTIDSSPDLRSQKEIILRYLDDPGGPSGKEPFGDFRRRQRGKELDQIIRDNGLKPEKAEEFCSEWIRTRNPNPFAGRGFADILPAMSLFGKEGEEREKKKAEVRKRLEEWAQKYAILG
ncbi:MAG: type I restriction endonuclease subunit R [Aeriscardovia sp.]|nr:type I restriction endonuclease subunit R [Aeriscardovia sp.]